MNERSLLIAQWFASRDFYAYLRPYKMEGKLIWRVTVERTAPTLIYVVSEDEDLDVAIAGAYRQTKDKLGIKRKTRKRARRQK